MLTNIYIPKPVRWLLVLVLLSQLALNVLRMATTAQEFHAARTPAGQYHPAQLITRFEHQLDRCEGLQP